MSVADHFDWEERNALPHLPPSLQRRLVVEHNQLRAQGFPRDAVLLHAEMEMGWFRRYCPAWVVEKIVQDHVRFRETGT